MSRHDPRGTNSTPPDPSSSPPRPPLGSPRARRGGIEESFFNVVWPLPTTVVIPSQARRMLAVVADLVIGVPIPIVALLVTSGLGGEALPKYDEALRFATLCYVMYGFYFALWESSRVRATPGKVLLDLRVATATDAPLSFADAMIRYFLRVATLLTANAGLWLAWRSPRGQALHDRLCGTFVVAEHVLPGRLRTAARPPQSRDLLSLVVASLVAYALVYQAGPAVMQQLDLADRFDDAIVALRPALMQGDLVGPEGQWSRRLREADGTLTELHVAIELDSGRHAVLLRAVDLAGDALSRDESEVPAVLIEQAGVDAGDATWRCRRQGLATYAAPRNCVDIAGSLPERNLTLASAEAIL